MKRRDFIDRLLRQYVSLQYTNNQYNCLWRVREQYAELTGLIDFNCGFKNGVCAVKYNGSYEYMQISKKSLRACKDAEERKHLRIRIKQAQMCCCISCYHETGHLSIVNPDHVGFMAKRFIKDVGFWREGKGCILPRGMRSETCLFYKCRGYKPKFLSTLIDIMHTPWDYSHNTPKFINPFGNTKRPRRKWLTPSQFREMLLKERKNGT